MCSLEPLLWKWIRLQYPKSIPTFIVCKGSLCSKFRRICSLELKLSHGNHSVYRLRTVPQHNMIARYLWSYKKFINGTTQIKVISPIYFLDQTEKRFYLTVIYKCLHFSYHLTEEPSSSVAKHKLLRDTKKQQDNVITSNRAIMTS